MDDYSFLRLAFNLERLSYEQAMCAMYLKISLSDFMTVFAARTTGPFWSRRPAFVLCIAFIVATGVSTLFAHYWPFSEMEGISWSWCLMVWLFCFAWLLVQDLLKVVVIHLLKMESESNQSMLEEDAKTRLEQMWRLQNPDSEQEHGFLPNIPRGVQYYLVGVERITTYLPKTIWP